MIPYKSINISQLNDLQKGTLADHLNMKVVDVGEDYLTMSMPVTSVILQPFGVVHGGALAALAENVASLAGMLVVGSDKMCIGLSLNTNHIKGVKEGELTAVAKPIHLGKSTHIWEVETKTESGVLINVSRMTLAVIDKK